MIGGIVLWGIVIVGFVASWAIKTSQKLQGITNKKAKLLIDAVRLGALAVAVWALLFAPMPFGWPPIREIIANAAAVVAGWIFTGDAVQIVQVFGGALLAVALIVFVKDIADGQMDGPAKTALLSTPILTALVSGSWIEELFTNMHAFFLTDVPQFFSALG